MDLTMEDIWKLLGQKDVLIYQMEVEIMRLQKLLAEHEGSKTKSK